MHADRRSLGTAVEGARPWWKGTRGEWFVVAQVALMLLVFLGPTTASGLPAWPLDDTPWWRLMALALFVIGGAIMVAGAVRLGPGLTPLPCPREGSCLIETGVFGLVRHPMYGGGLVLALGWTLLARGWLTLVYATALWILLEIKSRHEERWLVEKFPSYPAYRRRVRRFVPFIY